MLKIKNLFVLIFFLLLISACNNNKINEDVFLDKENNILTSDSLIGKIFCDVKRTPTLIKPDSNSVHFIEFKNDNLLSIYFCFNSEYDESKYIYDEKTGHLRHYDDEISFYVADNDSWKFFCYNNSYYLLFLLKSYTPQTSETLFTNWTNDDNYSTTQIELSKDNGIAKIYTTFKENNSKTERFGKFSNEKGIISIEFDDKKTEKYLYDGKQLFSLTQFYPASKLPLNVRN